VRAVNWATACGILLPLIGTAIVSILGWLKSDNAETGVDSLLLQLDKRVARQEKVINVQSEKLETMYRRLVFFQAHQEGFTAGKLYEKNEQLEKQLTELRAKRLSRPERTRRLIEILRGASQAPTSTKPAPPAPPPANAVQQIPRLHPKPFKRAD
jgi:hypothetical protein